MISIHNLFELFCVISWLVLFIEAVLYFILYMGIKKKIYLYFAGFGFFYSIYIAISYTFYNKLLVQMIGFTMLIGTYFSIKIVKEMFPKRNYFFLNIVLFFFTIGFLLTFSLIFVGWDYYKANLYNIIVGFFTIGAVTFFFTTLFFSIKYEFYKDLNVFINISSLFAFALMYIVLRNFSNSNFSFIVILIFSLLFIVSLAFNFIKQHKDLEELNATLEQKVASRTDDLQQSNEDLKKSKEEIEKLSQQKTDFFINLSHEIRTPLTLLKGYLDKYIKKQNVEKDEDIKVIKKSYDKLEKDILNSFDIERFNVGKQIYDNTKTSDFSTILNENLILFSELSKGNQI